MKLIAVATVCGLLAGAVMGANAAGALKPLDARERVLLSNLAAIDAWREVQGLGGISNKTRGSDVFRTTDIKLFEAVIKNSAAAEKRGDSAPTIIAGTAAGVFRAPGRGGYAVQMRGGAAVLDPKADDFAAELTYGGDMEIICTGIKGTPDGFIALDCTSLPMWVESQQQFVVRSTELLMKSGSLPPFHAAFFKLTRSLAKTLRPDSPCFVLDRIGDCLSETTSGAATVDDEIRQAAKELPAPRDQFKSR